MEETKIVAILSALADGVNPFTGELAAGDSSYQHPDVVRALYAAIDRCKQTARRRPRRADRPSNVGKPWSEEEDRRLLAAFDQGRRPDELAQELGRTLAGIEARLERHGRMSASERTTANRYPRERTGDAAASTS